MRPCSLVMRRLTPLAINRRCLHKLVGQSETECGMAEAGAKIVSLAAAASAGADVAGCIATACESLRLEKIIAVPTDTIYGVAGLAQSTRAVERIYSMKQRTLAKPLAICVADVTDVYKWGKVTVCDALLRELLPGPVTVVFERTLALNPELNPEFTLVGIRVPNHGFVRDVSRACGEPLALTSANISDKQSSVQIQEFQELWPHLDRIFDGGVVTTTADARTGSTVVDLSKRGKFTIIRQGSAFAELLDKVHKYGLVEDEKS